MTNAATILVRELEAQGATLAFGVPGESYLAVLDAMHGSDRLRFINCRQEGGAAMAADAHGKLTGRPGICFVTRGPGATNASAGVHIAFQDSTPMILFIGQVARDQIDREAFQEIDYRRMFGQMAKWVTQIDDPDRIPEYIGRAYRTALSGRPGPVVLALPEDMLTSEVTAVPEPLPRIEPTRSYPTPDQAAAFQDMLAKAERPLVVVGGGGWTAEACDNLQRFAEANHLPIGGAFRAQDRISNEHPLYVGHVGIGIAPYLTEAVKSSDLLIVLGARLGEMTTGGYTLFSVPRPQVPMIHIHPGAEELGRVYQPDLAIQADMVSACRFLAEDLPPRKDPPWRDFADQARQGYEAFTKPIDANEPLGLGTIVSGLRERLPDNTVITNGAGNYSIWVHRFFRYRQFGNQLAPTSGSMGYGMPAAVAAALDDPERPVVAFAGDGCFMMTCQEFGTAQQYGLKPIVIVVNNGTYGTIRMHQEREYPSKVVATDLVSPDFAAFALAFDGHGEVVTTGAEFPDALERALASGKASIIEVRTSMDQLTPTTTISDLRGKA